MQKINIELDLSPENFFFRSDPEASPSVFFDQLFEKIEFVIGKISNCFNADKSLRMIKN